MDLFDYFGQICKIPRESGNEEGMRQFLLSWAKENGIEAQRDSAGNIIARVPATKGYENRPSVALQGHMDMVCVKVPGSKHDFTKDPIETEINGDWLRAKETSLGADDGIGVAITMAIFTDKEAKHGPLEAIFTFSEETGMDGAFGLDGSLIKSKKLLNLDSEEEGIIYIGCAGGIDLVSNTALETTPAEELKNWTPITITIGGLKGGHSGGDIHLQRLNAISAMARILHEISSVGCQFAIASFNGGARRNVIPSSCNCTILVKESSVFATKQAIEKVTEELKFENKLEEPALSVKCEGAESEGLESEGLSGKPEMPKKVLTVAASMRLTGLLFALPHGVFTMSKALAGIVETSNNLAIVRIAEDGAFHMEISVRSNIDSAKEYLVNKIATIVSAFGFNYKIGDGYPSWTPDPNSKLAAFCAKAYEENTGIKPLVTAIHAGLECGVISSKVPGMDSVSIGPNLVDIHSTNEKVSISSAKRTYDFVKHLLAIIE